MKNLIKIYLRKKKSQAGLEFLILIGLFFTILGIVIIYANSDMTNFIETQQKGDITRTIANAANQISALGPGSSKTIAIEVPKNIKQGFTAKKQIIIYSADKNGISSTHHKSQANIFGLLEINRGTRYFILKAEDNNYISIAPLSNPDLWNNIEAYYSFEIKNDTHTLDATGRNIPATLIGDIDCNYPGYIGSACFFNGSNYIEIQQIPALESDTVTMMAWINLSSIPPENPYWSPIVVQFNQTSGHDEGYYLYINDTNPGFYIGCGSNKEVLSDIDIDFNKWYHIAGVNNGTDISIYINGVQTNSLPIKCNGQYIDTFSHIGYDHIYNRYFNGIIDEVIIFSRALDTEEINKIYRLGRELE
ncbi:MAG: LamG domain-containing protein [Candidatus Woesearchaeota archaeon]